MSLPFLPGSVDVPVSDMPGTTAAKHRQRALQIVECWARSTEWGCTLLL